MMEEVYRIVGICLGIPPTEITWAYYDKAKVHNKIGPISPQKFYEEYVKKVHDVNEKVKLNFVSEVEYFKCSKNLRAFCSVALIPFLILQCNNILLHVIRCA